MYKTVFSSRDLSTDEIMNWKKQGQIVKLFSKRPKDLRLEMIDEFVLIQITQNPFSTGPY